MGLVVEVKGFKAFARHLRNHLKQKQKKINKAREKTLRYAAKKIAELVPIAFEELKESIHVSGDSVIIDAPHAASVEVGSRPHAPPIEPLIKWVKLMGAKGLTPKGKVATRNLLKNSSGASTSRTQQALNAFKVASAIKAMRRGKKYDSLMSPIEIAYAIQKGIMIAGTKPHFFVKNSMPAIEAELLKNLQEAMENKGGG